MTNGCDYILFAPSDYAGLSRRLIALVIDLAIVIAGVSGISSAVAARVVPPDVWQVTNRAERQRKMNEAMRPVQLPTTLGCVAFAVIYHVLGRTLRGGTIGYRIAGIRLVDAAGRTPPLAVLFKRFLMAVPFTLLLGASYSSVRRKLRRQTTHDQWSGTWVVRKAAVPIGPAKPAYQTKLLGTMLFTWLDLEPVDAAPADNAPPLSAAAS
ncbi:RDD family protein [Phycisphaerae bacterium RAS2]|nr:RDD family protein [Phycisphaerae bacterium RAS2]